MAHQLKLTQRQSPEHQDADSLPEAWHPVIRRILLTRNVFSPEQLKCGLDKLVTPDCIAGLEDAAEFLVKKVVQGSWICVVGDYDADGATATAVVVRALRMMGHERVTYLVPNRFDYGYGLSSALVDSMEMPLPDILLTVDNGISSIAGVEKAHERGMKVIITDHHLPGEQLPAAEAIVNPRLPGSDPATHCLAGVGVAFYLMLALRAKLRERQWFDANGHPSEPNLSGLLDIVALGSVADLVPLDDLNRVLVSQGLHRMRKGLAVPGIEALAQMAGKKPERLYTQDLAFYIAPRLNAAGRMEDMSIGIECLLTDQEQTANDLAAQLHAINQERREVQDEMLDHADQVIEHEMASLQGEDLPALVCLMHEDWHEGIVGLVASRLKERLHRPVFVFAPSSDSSMIKGSGRSVDGVHLRDFLAEIDAMHPGLISKFGGHAMAAGLSMARSQFDAFRDVAVSLGQKRFAETVALREIPHDGSLGQENITLGFARQLKGLLPWGQGCPEPLFFDQFEVADARVVGSRHLKLGLKKTGSSASIEAIAFGMADKMPKAGEQASFLYRLDVNHFRGRDSVQLRIEQILD